MRLSLILLVAAAFVASSISLQPMTRELAHHEDKYPVNDEFGEEGNDDEKESDEAEERGWFSDKTTALGAFKKLVAQSGDDLVEAVSGLSKNEFDALFKVGQSQMKALIPGFKPGMSLDDFITAVKAAGVSDDMENALKLGYGKYLAHQMD